MKLISHLVLLLGGVLMITGCLPHERVWWSPDGSQAAVLLEDGMHVLKPGDTPGTPLVTGNSETAEMPGGVSWLPDGSGFVMVRSRTFPTWDLARVHIPAKEVEEVERLSLGVPGWVETLMASGANAKTAQELLQGSPLTKRGPQLAAFFCAYERKQQLIDAMLKRSPAGQELIKQLHEEKTGHLVHEICVVDLKTVKPGGPEPRILLRSLRGLTSPQVSRHHATVAFLRLMDEDEWASLEVCPLKGGEATVLAQQVGASYDWSPNGRSLVYTGAFSGTGSVMRRVHRVTALDEKGELASEEARGNVDNLALAVMPSPYRVQNLPDGRVLISALPLTLPMAGTEPEVESRLYIISEDGKTLTPVPTAPGGLPGDLGYFVVSPDGKRVAVAEGGSDAVAVVDLSSGKSTIVSPAHPKWQCRTLPAWKSATELTFAALDGTPAAPRWMIWSEEAGTRSLSASWPAQKTEDWLELKEEHKSQPAPDAKTP